MFFPISKIAWALISPLNLIFLVLLTAGITRIFSRALSRSLAVLGMCLFILFGIVPLGHNMLAFFESKTVRPAEMPERVSGILVLGGTFMTEITALRGTPSLNETGERIMDTLALARQYPEAVVVFSGGNGRLGGGRMTEAEATEQFLAAQQFPPDNIFYEDRSRNTYENIIYSRDLLLPQPEETWLLVTSAYHMPRAQAVARAAGWQNIIPWPTDYRTDGEIYWMPRSFDLLGNFLDLQVAAHEYIGFLGYHLGGKISL